MEELESVKISTNPLSDFRQMRILVIRHGETDHNLKRIMQGNLDTQLNEKGENQAREVGTLINQVEKVNGIYSSNLQRAYRTAELISDGNHSVERIPELRERYMGPIEGMTLQDAMAKLKEDNLPSLKSYGESPKEMEARLARGWDIVKDKAKRKGQDTIVLVSHGSALMTLFNHLVDSGKVGFATPEVRKAFEDNPRLSNCCVTIVEDDNFTAFAERWTDSIIRERDLV